ncbi:MAG TPA: 50S ribosomal protein L30 [Nitrososphaeraceae archaeon]|jgi:large subunit ribosomal protein L30|nr:50S ribosomal protein L30 [Thermoproteota archaeon]MDQ4022805.1 50S ribosomal protein L30 [Thermoproteota archaeon]HZA64941.1 50S ribosomal protein L30 [Nitrososphaeraceae archaeon]
MAYLVVRIRGTVNIPHWANNTLDNLNLDKRFRATVIPENPESLGMLRKVKEMVAWTSADSTIIKELLEKRGKKTGFKPITNSDLPEGYNTMEELASAIADNRITLSKIRSIKPWFALNSPRGGFKRKTKTQYSQDGILGEDKGLTDIVKRML